VLHKRVAQGALLELEAQKRDEQFCGHCDGKGSILEPLEASKVLILKYLGNYTLECLYYKHKSPQMPRVDDLTPVKPTPSVF
jgi:hypothetical protein